MGEDEAGLAGLIIGGVILLGIVAWALAALLYVAVVGGAIVAAIYGLFKLIQFLYETASAAMEPWLARRHYRALGVALDGEAGLARNQIAEAMSRVDLRTFDTGSPYDIEPYAEKGGD